MGLAHSDQTDSSHPLSAAPLLRRPLLFHPESAPFWPLASGPSSLGSRKDPAPPDPLFLPARVLALRASVSSHAQPLPERRRRALGLGQDRQGVLCTVPTATPPHPSSLTSPPLSFKGIAPSCAGPHVLAGLLMSKPQLWLKSKLSPLPLHPAPTPPSKVWECA